MIKYIFISVCLGLVLSSCGASKTGSSTDTSDTPAPAPSNGTIVTTPGTSPTATLSAPLNLQIYAQYDTTKGLEYQTFAEQNSVTCVATTSAPVATCTLNIQEGRLYFSSLNFQLAWNTSQCKILVFQPYFYHASDLAGFLPPWSSDTAINCSTAGGNTPPKNCWGGAAPYLVIGFPKYTGYVFLSDESLPPGPQVHPDLTLPSAYSLAYASNRLTSNDMAVGKRSTSWNYNGANLQPRMTYGTATDSYIAGSFADYTISCVDDYYDPLPYKINLFINDVNSAPTNPVRNDFFTWTDLQ